MRALAAAAALLCGACTTIQSTRYPDGHELVAHGAKVRGLVQVNRATLTLLLDFVDVVPIDWDTTTALLMSEATALGARGVQVVSARTSPRGGVWSLLCLLACVNSTELVALALAEPDTSPAVPEAKAP